MTRGMEERMRLRIMTEEQMKEERRQLEERADWEWEGRSVFVPDGDNGPYKA